jgi:hypothetical protein
MALRIAAVPIAAFLAAASAVSASILRIPEDHATIQAGIDAAQSGDVIEIADGTYGGDGNRDLVIVGKSLTIRSASGDASACVIDCTPANPVQFDFSHGFHVDGAATAGTVFENVTIRNARSRPVFRGLSEFTGSGVAATGTSIEVHGVGFVDCDVAGVYGVASGITMTDCRLDGVPPEWPIFSYGLYAASGSSVVVTGCTFTECAVAVRAAQSSVTLGASELVGNTVGFEAAASTGTITGSTISLNSGSSSAGGGLSFHDSTFELESSRIAGNSCTTIDHPFDPNVGGIGLSGTTFLTMTNCSVTGNRTSLLDGAGIHGTSPSVLLAEHCVIAGNHGRDGGGLAGTLQADLTNCIVWGNCATGEGNDLYLGAGSAVRFECSDVDASGIAGPGAPIWIGTNLFVDPLFCEPKACLDAPVEDGVYTLRTRTSPAYNHPECGRMGLLTEGCTLAVVPESWSRIKARYR